MKHNFNQDWLEHQSWKESHKQIHYQKKIDTAIPVFDMFVVACYVYEYYTGKFPVMKDKISWDALNDLIEQAGLSDKIKRFLDDYMMYRNDLVKYPYLNRAIIIKQCLEGIKD